MSNATYCDKKKQKDCKHWDAKKGDCKYKRPDKSCFIGGIEDKYKEEDEQS